MTLDFLGDVAGPREETVRAALSAVRFERLEMHLTTPEIWLSAGVAVLKPDAHPALDRLQKEVASAAAYAGIRPEGRVFTPHVTLAKRAAGAAAPNAPVFITWAVSSFELLWSRLAPSFDYRVLESWPAA